MIRVVLIDDHVLLRGGIRAILESDGDIEVVAEAEDGAAGVELVLRHHPDVVLMDVRMPRLDGIEATRRLIAAGSRARVLVVTTFDHDEYVGTAIRNGASGFLLKDAGPALLVEAVRAAAAGDALVSPSITVRFLQHFSERANPPSSREPTTTLTEREEDIVRSVARGMTNAEIGEQLFISLSTVKSHVANIQSKLGVRNRVEIAGWVWETGRMA